MPSDTWGQLSLKDRPLTSMIITGVISLITGVIVAIAVQYFTEKKFQLEYDVIASALFDGKNKKIAIVQINITNTGQKEIENSFTAVSFSKSTITEPRVSGLVDGTYSMQQQRSSLELKTGYVNPGETFSLQMLIEPSETQLEKPTISVRSKGVNAVPRHQQRSDLFSDGPYFLIPIFATVLAMMLITRYIIIKVADPDDLALKHIGDQRDVFAYALGAHKFYTEADRVRHLERTSTYWSQSDHLAELCIESKDADKLRAGVNCLTFLLDYTGIDEPFRLLIHYNIARMSACLKDDVTAKRHLALARGKGVGAIEKRVAADENLSRLT